MTKKNTATIKQNTTARIARYLESRSTAATSKEIARATKANESTVRKLLGVMTSTVKKAKRNVKGPVAVAEKRTCRVSGKVVNTYQPTKRKATTAKTAKTIATATAKPTKIEKPAKAKKAKATKASNGLGEKTNAKLKKAAKKAKAKK